MKKYINSILFSALCILALAACNKDKDSEGLTYVENFPVITDAEGNKLETVNLKLGESFTPACKATLGGSDITSKVNISILDLISGNEVESIPTDAPGMYEIHYTAKTETELDSWSEKQSVYVDAGRGSDHGYGCRRQARTQGRQGEVLSDFRLLLIL